jgi:hypothetical protein
MLAVWYQYGRVTPAGFTGEFHRGVSPFGESFTTVA